MDDESLTPHAPDVRMHRTRDALKGALHHYQNGQWSEIAPESILIQARTPDGPIELTIEMLAALLWPDIQRRIGADLSDNLGATPITGGRP